MASSIHIRLRHKLTEAEAQKRVGVFIKRSAQKHNKYLKGIKWSYEDGKGIFGGTVKGYDVAGSISVTASAVTVRGSIPFSISLLFGEKIKMLIKEQLEKILSDQ
jgi:hypothetical protein